MLNFKFFRFFILTIYLLYYYRSEEYLKILVTVKLLLYLLKSIISTNKTYLYTRILYIKQSKKYS